MSGPKLVFFDFDGVVLDSAKIKTIAFPEVFKDYPEHQEAITAYHLEHQGVSRYKKFEWIYAELLQQDLSDDESQKLGERFSEIVLSKILTCASIPGSFELLEILRELKVPCVVASGTPETELRTIVEKRELSLYFSEVWGSPKSKSDIIRDVLARHKLEAKDCLFLGDATTDFKAASEMKVPFVAVYSEEMEDYWEELKLRPIRNLMNIAHYFSS